MELIIIHNEPTSNFVTGKWTTNQFQLAYYILVENKRKEVQLTSEVLNFVRTTVIDNNLCTGKYDRDWKRIEYKINLEESGLEIEEIPSIDNLIFVKFAK